MELTKSLEMEKIAEKVLQEVDSLKWIKDTDFSIGYYTSKKDKKKGDKTVFGECIRPPKRFDVFIPYDFLIVFYKASELFDDEQMEILMHHELLHVGIKDGKPATREHDFEDFKEIVDRYGSRWCDVSAE